MSKSNVSYELIYNNVTNKTEYYFTYYQPFDRSRVSLFAETIVLIALCFISVIVNVYVGSSIICRTQTKQINKYLILNMVVADLLLALTIPLVVYIRIMLDWQIANVFCGLIPYLQLVASTVLLWTLTLISYDRHRSISMPSTVNSGNRPKLRPARALALSVCAWSIVAVVLAPVNFWFAIERTVDGRSLCTVVARKSPFNVYTILALVPTVTIVYLSLICLQIYNYCALFRKIIATRNTWATSCVFVGTVDAGTCGRSELRRQSEISLGEILTPWSRRFSNALPYAGGGGGGGNNGFGAANRARHGSMSQQEELRFNKRVKVIRTLTVNIALVLITWLPVVAMPALIVCDGSMTTGRDRVLSSTLFFVVLTLAFANTIVNPTLVGVYSDKVRWTTTMMSWCRCCCKKNMRNVIALRNNLTECKSANTAIDEKTI